MVWQVDHDNAFVCDTCGEPVERVLDADREPAEYYRHVGDDDCSWTQQHTTVPTHVD
jgi:hypothetical protein